MCSASAGTKFITNCSGFPVEVFEYEVYHRLWSAACFLIEKWRIEYFENIYYLVGLFEWHCRTEGNRMSPFIISLDLPKTDPSSEAEFGWPDVDDKAREKRENTGRLIAISLDETRRI
jgi:hypothetical protein